LSDDDEDDVNSTDVDNTLDSHRQISRYRRSPNGFADHRIPSDWHLGGNNYTTTQAETSGNLDHLIILVFLSVLILNSHTGHLSLLYWYSIMCYWYHSSC